MPTIYRARFFSMGANMLIHAADILLFKKHLKQELTAIRKSAGLSLGTQGKRNISI